ncbi:MAG: CdaR family protein [Negativicutes bacterium]|nr:CdaR family protein [Negativicutes bacterium]
MIRISLFKNWPLKILSLLLAMIVWLYVMSDQNPPVETSITVPLEVHNLGEGMVASDLPETVKISLKTSRGRLSDIGDNDIRAYIDVAGLGEGRHTLRIKTFAPPKVEVAEVNPERVSFHIDESGRRTLPVEAQFASGNENPSLKAELSEKQVVVTGPSSLLQTVYRAVVYIDPSNRPASFRLTAEPVLLGYDGKPVDGLKVQPVEVEVTVTGNDFVRRQVKVNPQLTGKPARKIQSVQCDPGQVWLSGPQAAVNNPGDSFVATEPIDVGKLTGTQTIEVRLIVPDGVRCETDKVRVTIEF